MYSCLIEQKYYVLVCCNVNRKKIDAIKQILNNKYSPGILMNIYNIYNTGPLCGNWIWTCDAVSWSCHRNSRREVKVYITSTIRRSLKCCYIVSARKMKLNTIYMKNEIIYCKKLFLNIKCRKWIKLFKIEKVWNQILLRKA